MEENEIISNHIRERLLGIEREMSENNFSHHEQMQILVHNKKQIISTFKNLTRNVRYVGKINKDDWGTYILDSVIPSREANELKEIVGELGDNSSVLTNILVGSFYENKSYTEETYVRIGEYIDEDGFKKIEDKIEELMPEAEDPNLRMVDEGLILNEIVHQIKVDSDYLKKLNEYESTMATGYKVFKEMTGEHLDNLAIHSPIKDDWSPHSGARLELAAGAKDPGTTWKTELKLRKNVMAMLDAGADRFNHIFNVYIIRTPKTQYLEWNNGESTIQSLVVEALLTGNPQQIKAPNRWLSQLGGANVSPAVLSFLTNSVVNGDETIKDDVKSVKRFGREVNQVLFNQRKGQGNEFTISLTANWEANIIFDIWKLEHQTDTEDGIVTDLLALIPGASGLMKNETSIIYAMPSVFSGDNDKYRYDVAVIDVSGVKRQVISNTTVLPAAWTLYKDVKFTNFGELTFSRTGPEELNSTLKGNYLNVESGITNLALL